jgi:hypothetical protein
MYGIDSTFAYERGGIPIDSLDTIFRKKKVKMLDESRLSESLVMTYQTME